MILVMMRSVLPAQRGHVLMLSFFRNSNEKPLAALWLEAKVPQ